MSQHSTNLRLFIILLLASYLHAQIYIDPNMIGQTGLTPNEKQLLLDKHNELRNLIASGGQSPNPKASNMIALNWDDNLAKGAQTWADSMQYAHSSKAGYMYGENLAQSLHGSDRAYDPQNHVQLWYDEVKVANWNSNYATKYQFLLDYAHFSQVAWATTTSIGCGHSYFFDGQYHVHYTVCRYTSPGNVSGQAMYKSGDPCTECGTQTCNTIFTSLCGQTKIIVGATNAQTANGQSGSTSGGSTGGTSGGTSGGSTGGTSGGTSGSTSGGTTGGTSGGTTGGNSGGSTGGTSGGSTGGTSGGTTGGTSGGTSGGTTGGTSGGTSGNTSGGSTGGSSGNTSGTSPQANAQASFSNIIKVNVITIISLIIFTLF